MKEKFNKFKKWLFRPVSAKVKTNGIILGLATLFTFSIIMAFCVHWTLCFIPVFLLVLVLYCAKLPIDMKKTIEDKQKAEAKKYAKKEK